VIDAEVVLIDGSFHEVDSSELALRLMGGVFAHGAFFVSVGYSAVNLYFVSLVFYVVISVDCLL